MMLIQQQQDLIFGTLLGDGNLQTENQGRTWRYRALQQTAHKEYLEHKYQILKPLCGSAPVYTKIYDSRNNTYFERGAFNTLQTSSLNFYGNMFYTYDKASKKFIKDVPVEVEKFLTPAALAYFYMDDGSLKWPGKSNAMRICTEGFSNNGVIRIQNALKNLYNIKTNLHKKKLKSNKERLRIYIPEKSSKAFVNLIKPYLVKCMQYKVADGNKSHL